MGLVHRGLKPANIFLSEATIAVKSSASSSALWNRCSGLM
jgi:serine/threonine protein kinase